MQSIMATSDSALRDPQNAADNPNSEMTMSAQLQPGISTHVTEDARDEDYIRALELSREEFNRKLWKNRIQQNKDREVSMFLSLSNVFTPLSTPDADTLIYIGPPPRAPGQSRAEYQYVEERFSTLYRMHSQALKDVGSSVFDRLLGPKSERTRRRFGKDGILTGANTEGIKYYIDLRPAEEGDEAVELITDLTCTQGILNWHKAKNKYSIAPTMVCGRDDFASPLERCRDAEAVKDDDANGTEPPLEPEAEYSALRHRSAIERVLQAIGYVDPKLDSAPKMWTYFQVAKHLDVAKHERVSGWITKWLYSHPNSNFIQSNPEAVYRIAMGTMSTNMISDAYSMLVGEKALLDASDPSLRLSFEKSVHGRPLEILDDDERNRIDHAAASLQALIKTRFEYLTDENMDWLKQSKEYSKVMLLKPKNDEEKGDISITDRMIKDFVRGRLMWVLARDFLSDHSEFDQAMGSCREFREDLPMYFNEIYRTLNESQRLLTRTLWIALHTEKIEQGDINAWTPAKGPAGVLHLQPHISHNYDCCPIGDAMIAREDRKPGTGVKKILYEQLANNINKLNKISALHYYLDRQIDCSLPNEESNYESLSPQSREQSFGQTCVPPESSTANSKHDLIEIDSDDDVPLEMNHRPRTKSGSEKRRRLSDDHAGLESIENHPLATTLPLRVRNPDLTEEEIFASEFELDTHDFSQSAHLASLPNANHGITEGIQNSNSVAPLVQPSTQNADYMYELSMISRAGTKFAFDTSAKSVADKTRATSWRSFDGDVYMRAEISNLVEQNAEALDTAWVWVATPEPFKWSETTTITGKSWRESGGLMEYWQTRQQVQPHIGKEYWRASTCQLYCKSPDGSINLVHEDFAAIPTLAEASARILDNVQLRNYTLAYDAYARHLAEIIVLPYWTALNGDMYLRNPPKTMSANSNVWSVASSVFDSAVKQIRYENSTKVEYWRSPAGHLFRRRSGRIELYTDGTDEPVPPSAASILAAPLKIVTKKGMQVIAPHARFVSTPGFDAKRSTDPQNPVLSTPFQTSPLKTKTTPIAAKGCGYISLDLQTMLAEFSDILSKYCDDILHPPHIYHGVDLIPRNLMDTLMCLTEDEWKYLPLWAGGCDDGTGGVFDEADVPNLEAGGFAGGKRGLGNDAVDGKAESDGWSQVGSEDISTLGRASKLATDGTETVKSFDSASGFMRQDDVYELIMSMKEARDEPSVARDVDGDQVTVMGAASDIQGELFGDIDDDKEVEVMDEDDKDDGFELVDESDGDFVAVAKD